MNSYSLNQGNTYPQYSAILPQIKNSDTKQIVSNILKKLNSLSEESCTELTAATKRRKLTERDHSIKTRLARTKEQSKQSTVAEGSQRRAEGYGQSDVPSLQLMTIERNTGKGD